MIKRILDHYSYTLTIVVLLLVCQTKLLGQIDDFSTVGNVYPSSKSVVGSQVTGRVDQIYVEVGQEVKKGQSLMTLDPTFFQIDLSQKTSKLESAKVELADSEKDFLRMARLWEKNNGEAPSVSLKKYEEAKSRHDQAAMQVKQEEKEVHRAEANLDETVIRAPFDGVITKKFVDKGEPVSGTLTSLVEIQSLIPVYLEFSVPQIYLSAIKVGTPIQFEIEGVNLSENTAKIDLIYPCLDESTRSIRCRAILSNQDRKILPGSLAKILIKGNNS